MISLTTICCGRLDDLKLTLATNMEAAQGIKGSWEYVFVDWGCDEQSWHWVVGQRLRLASRLGRALADHLVIVRTVDRGVEWHYSRAKNAAFRASTGDVIANVDADNFLSWDFCRILEEAVTEHRAFLGVPVVILPKGRMVRSPDGAFIGTASYAGAGGRIALHRTVFDVLNGYDEEMVGYGGDEVDMLVRANNAGFRIVELDVRPRDLRFIATPPDSHDREEVRRILAQAAANNIRVNEAKAEGKSTANLGKPWGDEPLELLGEDGWEPVSTGGR